MTKQAPNNFKGKKKDKTTKQPRINNKITLGFYIDPETPESVVTDIETVLATTPFDKISFPITTYKSYLDKRIPDDDNRVSAVGYVKGYDTEKKLFTVIIFNGVAETITKFEQPILEVVFSSRDNKLNIITRMNIVPTEESPKEDTAEDVPVTTDAVETVEAENIQDSAAE